MSGFERCKTLSNCSEAATLLPDISLYFEGTYIDSDGKSASDFMINISSSFYLYEDSTTGYCESAVTVASVSDTNVDYVLGDPFFRQYYVMLNYSD